MPTTEKLAIDSDLKAIYKRMYSGFQCFGCICKKRLQLERLSGCCTIEQLVVDDGELMGLDMDRLSGEFVLDLEVGDGSYIN